MSGLFLQKRSLKSRLLFKADLKKVHILRTCLAVTFCFLFLASSAFAAEPKSVLEVKQAANVYFKNKNWTPFAATIELSFFKNEELKSKCSGAMVFDPLRKKLLMECYGQSGKPVFIFRNDDLRFLLYLPQLRKAWNGNIFELEYTPDFDSHLKPLDLYRAISPEAFTEEQVISAFGVGDGMEIEIAKPYQNSRYLARRLVMDEHGQLENETFMAPDGGVTTSIARGDFKKKKNKIDPVTKRFFYAQKTVVSHPESGDSTMFEITSVKMYDQFPDDAFDVWLPEDVEIEPIQADPAAEKN